MGTFFAFFDDFFSTLAGEAAFFSFLDEDLLAFAGLATGGGDLGTSATADFLDFFTFLATSAAADFFDTLSFPMVREGGGGMSAAYVASRPPPNVGKASYRVLSGGHGGRPQA